VSPKYSFTLLILVNIVTTYLVFWHGTLMSRPIDSGVVGRRETDASGKPVVTVYPDL
jgi:hypothetical protein